jgi:lauroyl/myristoyl acyltransferase
VTKLLIHATGWLVAHAPHVFLRPLARLLGRVILLIPKRRHLLFSNLHHAFPGRPRAWHARVARLSCARLIETGMLSLASPFFSDARIRRMAALSPELEAIMRGRAAAGAITSDTGTAAAVPARPLLIGTLHFAYWECLTWLGLLCPGIAGTGVIFRPLKNPVLNAWVKQTRERHGVLLLSRKNGLQDAFRIMRRGGAVSLLFDQNAGLNGALTLLLGRVCSTSELAGTLAAKFGAKVVIFYPRRLGFWTMRFEAVEIKTAATAVATAAAAAVATAAAAAAAAADDGDGAAAGAAAVAADGAADAAEIPNPNPQSPIPNAAAITANAGTAGTTAAAGTAATVAGGGSTAATATAASGVTLALNRWLETLLANDEELCASWLWSHGRWRTQDAPPQRLRLESKRDLLAADLAARGLTRATMPRGTRFWITMPAGRAACAAALPLLRRLRLSRPDAEITLLAEAGQTGFLKKTATTTGGAAANSTATSTTIGAVNNAATSDAKSAANNAAAGAANAAAADAGTGAGAVGGIGIGAGAGADVGFEAGVADRIIPLPPPGAARRRLVRRLRGEFPDTHILLADTPAADREARLINAPQRFGLCAPGRRRPHLTHIWEPPSAAAATIAAAAEISANNNTVANTVAGQAVAAPSLASLWEQWWQSLGLPESPSAGTGIRN